MVNVLHITEADLNDKSEYIGTTDVTNYDGIITIAPDLGIVKFKELRASGSITARQGTIVHVEQSVYTPSDLNVEGSIWAKHYITADSISVGGKLAAHRCIVKGDITVGDLITVSDGLDAGGDVRAENILVIEDLKAEGDVTVGHFIAVIGDLKAGGSVVCEGGQIWALGNITAGGDISGDPAREDEGIHVIMAGGKITAGGDINFFHISTDNAKMMRKALMERLGIWEGDDEDSEPQGEGR